MRLSRLTRSFGTRRLRDPLVMLSTPGKHEVELSGLFKGRMGFEGGGPVFAQPLMIVAFSNRSGSNLVCDYLLQTGWVGGASESLNHDEAAAAGAGSAQTSLPDHIRHLHATLAGERRILAIKASWDQLAMLLRHRIPAMFTGLHLLHCTRSDVVAQAVSYAIALRSGRWHSHQSGPPPDPAKIPVSEIGLLADGFHQANLLIRLLCEAHGLKRREIVYEAICQDNGAELAQFLRSAALVPEGWMPGRPRLERQADALNLALASGFLEQVRRATAGAL